MVIQGLKTFYATAARLDMEEVEKQGQKFIDTEPYLKVLDSMNIFITILNSYRQVIYANKSFLKLINIKDISSILGQRSGEILNCINASKCSGGCGTSTACRNCSAGNIVLNAIDENKELEDEVSIIRKIDGFDAPLNLFEKIVPFELGGETFYLASFTDATDSIIRRTMEKVFFHDVINTAGALKGLLNLLKTEVPKVYENEVAQVEGLFEGLIDEIQSQKQLLAAENNELSIEMDEFNSKEILRTLKNLYKGYSNAINKDIEIAEDAVSIDLKNDSTLVKRVVGNMLKNALEATKENEFVTMGCDITQNDCVRYWVKNAGYISEEVQNNIFKRAFSTKAKERGLGTYSMKLLGEKYLKGLVGFTSSENNGTCFYIEIPKGKL